MIENSKCLLRPSPIFRFFYFFVASRENIENLFIAKYATLHRCVCVHASCQQVQVCVYACLHTTNPRRCSSVRLCVCIVGCKNDWVFELNFCVVAIVVISGGGMEKWGRKGGGNHPLPFSIPQTKIPLHVHYNIFWLMWQSAINSWNSIADTRIKKQQLWGGLWKFWK